MDDSTYTCTFHREMLCALVQRLDLRNIVLVVQEWGGLLGLTLPMQARGRYSGLLVVNTAFATGDLPPGQGFLGWRACNNKGPDMAIGKLMARWCPQPTPAEAAACDAPFADASHKAGVRRFPNVVPATIRTPTVTHSRPKRANGFAPSGMEKPSWPSA